MGGRCPWKGPALSFDIGAPIRYANLMVGPAQATDSAPGMPVWEGSDHRAARRPFLFVKGGLRAAPTGHLKPAMRKIWI